VDDVTRLLLGAPGGDEEGDAGRWGATDAEDVAYAVEGRPQQLGVALRRGRTGVEGGEVDVKVILVPRDGRREMRGQSFQEPVTATFRRRVFHEDGGGGPQAAPEVEAQGHDYGEIQ
jgi:hypothetical protein